MGGKGECKPLVKAPLRVVARERKVVVGPYRRLGGSYHLALGLEVPVPYRPRWVLHVLADPKGLLRDEGVAEVLGYRAMIKHECLHKAAKRLAPAPLRSFLWVPGWGVPLVVVEEANGYLSYIPAADEYEQGGYGSAAAILDPAAENVLLDRLGDLIRTVKPQ